MSKEAIFVPGIWGPFYSSILPGLWDTEGGQRAAGKVVSITNSSKEEFEDTKGVIRIRISKKYHLKLKLI
jgi:ribulose kinase